MTSTENLIHRLRHDTIGPDTWRLMQESADEIVRLQRYEAQLERAAAILQKVLPIGEVKHIGLLEVAAGVEQLNDELAALGGFKTDS